MTLAAIAAKLNHDIPTAHGGAQWHPSTVRAVLQSLMLLVTPTNLASIRVAEKIGMHRVKETHHDGHRFLRFEIASVAPAASQQRLRRKP
jgi:hypothetical protein